MHPGTYAASTPQKPAVVMAGSGEMITYGELEEEANRVSRMLRSAGLRPGDHVAVWLENHPRFLPVVWGAHYAGLYYTAISTRSTEAEVDHVLSDSGADALVVSPRTAERHAQLDERTKHLRLRLAVDGPVAGFEDYAAAVAAQPATPLEERPQGQDMLYSSGTTGLPKGVRVAPPEASLDDPDPSTQLCQQLFGVTSDTVYLSPAPLYHAAPLRFCRAMLRSGATVVILERFDERAFLGAVERHRVTFTQVVPTMLVQLLKLPEADRKRHDLSSLAAVVHAAAPCPVEVKRRMIEWWGPILHEYYAGTEGNGFVYCTSEEWLAHEGTVGRAITGSLRILDEAGNVVPAGSTGTVYFEGGPSFEYHKDPAKTAGTRDPGGRGWTTLGDVGHVDEDGYLYLTDRKAYMIITGGVNVYPQEAESILAMHPAVADVAVLGVPHEEFGEEVKAVVQVADTATAGPELEAELIDYCRARLADVKCPRSVDFRAELPRLPTGKLLKRLLKDEYWAAAGRSI